MRGAKIIRDGILGKFFADWAAVVDALSPEFDVSPREVLAVRSVDWTLSKNQVFRANVSIEDLIDAKALTWPVVTIAVTGGRSPSDGKLFSKFGGVLSSRVEFHFSWKASSVPTNAEEAMDLATAVLMECLLDPEWGRAIGGGVSWTGEVEFNRGPAISGGENWIQTITVDQTWAVEE